MLMYVVDKKGKGELRADFHFTDYMSFKPRKLSKKIAKKYNIPNYDYLLKK